jgi:hypothetical protein
MKTEYVASKCHKIASEARASQSNTFIMVPSHPQSSDVSARYHPYQKKGQVKKSNVKKGKSNVSPSNRPCWNCIRQVIGPKIVLILKRV